MNTPRELRLKLERPSNPPNLPERDRNRFARIQALQELVREQAQHEWYAKLARWFVFVTAFTGAQLVAQNLLVSFLAALIGFGVTGAIFFFWLFRWSSNAIRVVNEKYPYVSDRFDTDGDSDPRETS